MTLNVVYYNTPPPELNATRRPLRRDNGGTNESKGCDADKHTHPCLHIKNTFLPPRFTIRYKHRHVHSTVYILVRHNRLGMYASYRCADCRWAYVQRITVSFGDPVRIFEDELAVVCGARERNMINWQESEL